MHYGNGLGLSLLAILLASCGGGGGDSGVTGNPQNPTQHKVSGSVTGLKGTGLTLQLSQPGVAVIGDQVIGPLFLDPMVIEKEGSFTFSGTLPDQRSYQVLVVGQPKRPAQFCTVSNGTGVLSGSDVTNVSVTCEDQPVGVTGTLSGLRGSGLKLQLRAAPPGKPLEIVDTITRTSDGVFGFKPVADLSHYDVSIVEMPPFPLQNCVLANGFGTLDGTPVSNLSVTCTTVPFTVGGTVSGLRGQGLVLQLNDGESLNIAANGAFTFPTPLPDGTLLDIKVTTQPTHIRQTCTVKLGQIQLLGANSQNAQVKCAATRILGTSGNDQGRAALADAAGNLYVAGNTTGNLEGSNAGGWDGFLIKLDADGELIWKRQFGSAGDEIVHAIEFDAGGGLLLVGSTTGNLAGHTSAGAEDVFVTKYDTSGNPLWTNQFGSSGADVAEGINLTGTGTRYIAGHTTGSLDGVTPAAGADVFVASLDANGAPLWLKQIGTPGTDQAFAVDVDVSHAYVVGSTTGNLAGHTNTSGGEAGFILEYDELGNLVSSLLGCQLDCLPTPAGTHFQSRFNAVAYGIGVGVVVGGWAIGDAPGAYGTKSLIYGRYQSGVFQGYSGASRSNGELEVNRIVNGRADGMFYLSGTIDAPSTPGKKLGFITQLNAATLAPRFNVETDWPGDESGLAVTSDLLSNSWLVGTATAGLDGVPGLGGEDVFVSNYDINGNPR